MNCNSKISVRYLMFVLLFCLVPLWTFSACKSPNDNSAGSTAPERESVRERCDSGDATACQNYANLQVMPTDPVAAAELLKKACYLDEYHLAGCSDYGRILLERARQVNTDEATALRKEARTVLELSCNLNEEIYDYRGCELLGDLALDAHDNDKAKQYYARVVRVRSTESLLTSKETDFSRTTLKFAQIYFAEDNLSWACPLYFAASRQGPTAEFHLAQQCPMFEKEFAELQALKVHALNDNRQQLKQINDYRNKGYAAKQAGRSDEARALFQSAIQAGDDNSYYTLSELESDKAQLLSTYQEGCRRFDDSACYSLFQHYLEHKNYQQARVTNARHSLVNLSSSLMNLGRLEKELGNLAQAEKIFTELCNEKAVLTDGDAEFACRQIPYLQDVQREIQTSEKENTLKCKQGDEQSCSSLASLYQRSGRVTQALPLLKAQCDAAQGKPVTDSVPGSWDLSSACLGYLAALKSAGQREEALMLATRLCASNGKYFCNSLGEIQREAGDDAAAISSYSKACLQMSDIACNRRELLLWKTKDHEQMTEFYRLRCQESSEAYGCLAAAIFSKAASQSNADTPGLLEQTLNLYSQACADSSSSQACTHAALLECLNGAEERGQQQMKTRCEELEDRYACKFLKLDICKDALKKFVAKHREESARFLR